MNLRVENTESFAWAALQGLLAEFDEINADIELKDGTTMKDVVIERGKNAPQLARSSKVVVCDAAGEHTLQQDAVEAIRVA